jgi:hypothetical protein
MPEGCNPPSLWTLRIGPGPRALSAPEDVGDARGMPTPPEFIVRVIQLRGLPPWLYVYRSGVMCFQKEMTTREEAEAQAEVVRERLANLNHG